MRGVVATFQALTAPRERPWLRVVRRGCLQCARGRSSEQSFVRDRTADWSNLANHSRPLRLGRDSPAAGGGGAPCANSPLPSPTRLSTSTYHRPDCVCSSPRSRRRAASAVIALPSATADASCGHDPML